MNVKLCALVLALLLLAGCGASVSVEKTEPIDFYFCAAARKQQKRQNQRAEPNLHRPCPPFQSTGM